MTIVLWCALGVLIGGWIGWWWRGRQMASPVPPVHVGVVAAPEPEPRPSSDEPSRRPMRRGRPVRIRLMSGSGRRCLGELTIDEGRRRPSIQARGSDGALGQFLAHRIEDGAWVYRRVGVTQERRH